VFRVELRSPKGDLIAAQESAEGIVRHAVGKSGTVLRPKGAALERSNRKRWSKARTTGSGK
jgi:hypothetical protein